MSSKVTENINLTLLEALTRVTNHRRSSLRRGLVDGYFLFLFNFILAYSFRKMNTIINLFEILLYIIFIVVIVVVV